MKYYLRNNVPEQDQNIERKGLVYFLKFGEEFSRNLAVSDMYYVNQSRFTKQTVRLHIRRYC